MQTYTFSFADDGVFEAFLTAGSSIVAQVRRIAFRLEVNHYVEYSNTKDWADTLRKISYLSDRLESLEGVQISAQRGLVSHWRSQPFDLFGPSFWERYGLSEIVGFFQQYRLKRELTSCDITGCGNNVHYDEDYKDCLAQLSSIIREHLLDYMGYAHMEG